MRGAPLGAPGATGSCWTARRRDGAGEPLVLKLFHPRACNATTRQRVVRLVSERLDRASPGLHAPFDMVDGPIGLGHVATLAPGRPLDAYLEAPTNGFLDHVIAAAAITSALAVLERRGVAHGDLHPKNVMLDRGDGVLHAFLIDFDNYVAAGLPPPLSIGQISYYAPEIRRDPLPSRVGTVTDRYALTVLLHELLLARHPADAAVEDPDRFDHVMRAGGWPDDPAGSPHPRSADGLPVSCLDTRLQNLFRRGLAPVPDARPSPAEWFAALRRAAANVYLCDDCRQPFLVDGGKRCCPHCRHGFAEYHLGIPSRAPVVLRDQPVALSRRHFRDGAGSVSHAVLRRRGPDAILEPTGRVPIWRVGARGPVPLEPGRSHLLRPGERLRFGDVEVEVAFGRPAAPP